MSPAAALHRQIWHDLHAEYLGALAWREIDRLAAYRWRRATGIRSDQAAGAAHHAWILADQQAAVAALGAGKRKKIGTK